MGNVKTDLLKDFESSLPVRLILIADKPLPEDKTEIFDSYKGLQYLTECFKSKFKAAETHICAISNIDTGNFSRTKLISILENYANKNLLEKNKLLIAFIGNNAFESFKNDYLNNIDYSGKICTLKEYTSIIEIFDKSISIKDNILIPYIILPDINSDYSDIPTILDSTTLANELSI